ncbi:MAG: hypothetical protein M1820_010286 [Bogoriella megaspora]|nr:MAG: hypothetical protein M1820_010286 [Bogoriella megaspora]
MADNVEVTLYDIPARPPVFCWSYNPWKVRLLLNYKQIPYKTQWTEYPDLAPVISALNVPPNDDGNAAYTSPAVVFHSDKTAIMESRKIAAEIEKRFPSKPVPIETPGREKVVKALQAFFPKVRTELIPNVPRNVLPERSKEYFERTRSETFGMDIYEWEKIKYGEKPWEACEGDIKELGKLYHEDESGPFLEGNEVTFADFTVVGILEFIRVLNKPGFDRVLEIDTAFVKLYDACKPWLERTSY